MKKYWNRPKSKNDFMNSLSDFVAECKKNDLVVYHVEQAATVGVELFGENRREAFNAAAGLASRGRGALVSKPTGPASNKNRSFEYMIQVS